MVLEKRGRGAENGDEPSYAATESVYLLNCNHGHMI